MLDERQLDSFRENGFVNAGKLFDADELGTIAREYDRLVTLDTQVLGNEREGVFPYRAMLNFRSPALREILCHPKLLSIATAILGEDVRFWWDQGINKLPGSKSYIAWHQDNGYTQGRMPEYLTCWLALDASSLRNGGLEVVPGSHRGGQREHHMEGVHAVVPDAEVDNARAIALDAGPGDMLLFSSLLVHQTVGNETRDEQRRAWVIQYCRGDQRNEVTGEVYDNRAWVVKGGEPVDEPWSERRFDMRRDHA